jgi:phenylacetate-CoA ligase
LGSDRIPCYLGQYSPANFLISQVPGGDGKGEIEITVLNPRSVSPKIRYNIRDEGGVIPFAAMASLLAKLGRTFASLVAGILNPPIAPLPFIYLFGRSDGTVFFNGAMISPTDIEKALFARPALMSRLNGFKMAVETDDERSMRLVIYLEMREGLGAADEMRMQVEQAIISELQESNECFRHVFEHDPRGARPRFVFSSYKTGVFFMGDTTLKRRYIVNS